MLDILFGWGIFLVSWNGIYREDADSAEGAECGPGLNYTTCCEHLYTSPSFYSEYKCQPKVFSSKDVVLYIISCFDNLISPGVNGELGAP